MSLAYLDTSCLLSVALDEVDGSRVMEALRPYSDPISSNLLEAEMRSALMRERISEEPDMLAVVGWILPSRPLGPEIQHVLEFGLVRGADLWHLATALYAADAPEELPFLTLDKQQETVASSLGFPTPLAQISL